MKKRTTIWICSSAILAVFFMLSGSCKKSNDENNNKTTPKETGTATDFDGNVYKTIKIGTQWWMAENLKTTHYNDGTPIPEVTEYLAWRYSTTPGYCWFDNDSVTNKNLYGALYNWYAVNTGKLAPTGWHVPTDLEWWTLINYLGGWEVAGGKMKSVGTIEAGTGLWYAPNTGATNESGFSAIPAGTREEGGSFIDDKGYGGDWWTATDTDSTGAFDCVITYMYAAAGCGLDAMVKSCGFSVRCVKN
jgi:uncharacterized protein (TIGR02145 family)